ncbi:MAG: LpxA family transferase [Cyclobacteriaceae bacterium]
MIYIDFYIRQFSILFPALEKQSPWTITGNMASILLEKIKNLGADYKIFNDVAIHKTVAIDSNAILKGPAIISAGCFIGAHSYLRGGVFLDEKVSIGPACEVKTSVIFTNSALGHFNFIGDSLVGAFVNLEAGSVVANHYNERVDKIITVVADGKSYSTGVEKFGALIGDHCKIGANAVLAPGTILAPNTIVGRLELIEQKP